MSGPSHDPSDYRERDAIPIRRALVSVSDKTGLVELATALAAAGVEIVSTGSTAKTIRDAAIPVTEVAEVTGFPESLDGRVRTLHPAIHAGLLADLRLASHESELAELGIAPFELVVSNLYPFVETVASGAAVNFDASTASDRYLVIGFSSLTEREISNGIARLADVLSAHSASRRGSRASAG